MNAFSRRSNPILGWAALAGLVLYPATGLAQWVSQTLNLHSGWNAVFLEVQPEPRECDQLFASLHSVESVWRFNRKQAVVQYIADPNTLVPSQPDWLTWLPRSHPLASQSSLFVLEGGQPYLIKLADTAATTN